MTSTNKVIWIIYILLVLSLVGCSTKKSEQKAQDIPISNNNTIASQEKSGQEDGKINLPSVNLKEADMQQINSKVKKEESDTSSLDEYKKRLCPNGMRLDDVIQFDMDKDGNVETILSYGTGGKPKLYVVALRNLDGKYSIVDKFEEEYGGHIEAHNLYNNGTKQLLVSIVPADRFSIYQIYELKNNKFVKGPFLDHDRMSDINIEDIDKDGVDEVIISTIYKDIQKHQITYYKKWNGNSFQVYKKDISYGNGRFTYPKEREKVIQNYIEADIFDLPEEKQQLTINSKLAEISLRDYFWEDSFNEIEVNYEVIGIEGDSTIVRAEQREEKHVYFLMILDNGKWKIEDISIDGAYDTYGNENM